MEELATITFFAQSPQPMLADHQFVPIRVLVFEWAMATFSTSTFQKVFANRFIYTQKRRK
jgi:hypothetical protein